VTPRGITAGQRYTSLERKSQMANRPAARRHFVPGQIQLPSQRVKLDSA
jgi:hypothetical protein